MRQISGSVGLRGVNRKDDVRTIQELLNLVPHAAGGPLEELDEDGICGRKTNGAIEKLQARKWGWQRVTTRVSPGDPTWQLLLSYDQPSQAAAVQAVAPPPPPDPPKLVSRLFSVWIAARPSQRLDQKNLYFLVTDQSNQIKALYYFGGMNSPPPLQQPVQWGLTMPTTITTNQALGAADWAGDAVLSEEGDVNRYTASLWVFPEALARHGVQIGLHSSVQTPEKSFSRSQMSAPFRLVDSSASVQGL
jgi:hypothetical protein